MPILSIANNTDYTDHVNTETMLVAGFWEAGKGMAIPYSKSIVTYEAEDHEGLFKTSQIGKIRNKVK